MLRDVGSQSMVADSTGECGGDNVKLTFFVL